MRIEVKRMDKHRENNRISIYLNDNASYHEETYFNPSTEYPEYPFKSYMAIANHENKVYEMVRNALALLKLDIDNYGNKNWNPLGEICKPGDTIVIKPNFVHDIHADGDSLYSIITHPSVIRAVVDYVYIAIEGRGKIIIADSPIGYCNFDNLKMVTKVQSIVDLYNEKMGFKIDLLDLREWFYSKDQSFYTMDSKKKIDGDPEGYSIVDLGNNSFFYDLEGFEKIYGSDYDRSETIEHHTKNKNEYCISNTILSADVIISIPKLKTHKKAGVTMNMKNMIGINCDKNYLPHFRIGSQKDGGDEFPKLEGKNKKLFYFNRVLLDKCYQNPNKVKDTIYIMIRKIYSILKKSSIFSIDNKEEVKKVKGGSWYGNNTLWRTILDLNKIIEYSDKSGIIHNGKQRRCFSVIDGIIAGEGEGPMRPSSRKCGIIMAGEDFTLMDCIAARIMGFDYKKIPHLAQSIKSKYASHEDLVGKVKLYSNCDEIKNVISSNNQYFYKFEPSLGWKEHIEIDTKD